jgi:hypothetical protein
MGRENHLISSANDVSAVSTGTQTCRKAFAILFDRFVTTPGKIRAHRTLPQIPSEFFSIGKK